MAYPFYPAFDRVPSPIAIIYNAPLHREIAEANTNLFNYYLNESKAGILEAIPAHVIRNIIRNENVSIEDFN